MCGSGCTSPLSDHSIGLEQHTIGSLKNWKKENGGELDKDLRVYLLLLS